MKKSGTLYDSKDGQVIILKDYENRFIILNVESDTISEYWASERHFNERYEEVKDLDRDKVHRLIKLLKKYQELIKEDLICATPLDKTMVKINNAICEGLQEYPEFMYLE